MVRLAVISFVAVVAGCASATGVPVSHIDGSSAATFERSVALLQKSLPARRREQFEVALGVLWLRNTAPSERDIDADGVITRPEVQAHAKTLQLEADELLTEIQRGDLLSAIEERETRNSALTASQYRAQLHGLTPVDVVVLANLSDAAYEARRQLNEQKFRSIYCWRENRPDSSVSRITLRRCAS